jgi:PQQ-like domain
VRRTTTAVAALVAVALLATAASAERRATTVAVWPTFGDDTARTGEAAAAPVSTARRAFFVPLAGRVTAQVLAAPEAGTTRPTLYVTTSDGRVSAVTERGYVVWTRDFGQLATSCPQLDGYGITGTGAIDASSHTLYVADAFGRLHALDLSTGRERAGWPVRVFGDNTRELVWGALLLVDGRVYVPTGSFCDTGPMQGHVYSVDVATRNVRSWAPVPAELGGGGGIWGWGGIAYSAQRDSLYVAVGNAFASGAETAGYGEHVVELSPTLEVRSASSTPEPPRNSDADLVGSPVVFDRSGCGELVAALKKDGTLYAWRAGDLGAGALWRVQLEQFDESNPVLAQPAYDAAIGALVVVTGKRIVRVDVSADCSPRLAWSRSLGTTTENGLPTIAGGSIWVTLSGRSWTLARIDAASGAIVARTPIGGSVLTAPTVVDGMIVLGSFAGGIQAFGPANAASPRTAASVAGHVSRPTRALEWVSRSDGVYASDDAGRSWHRIYTQPATTVLRTSRTAGMIAVGSPAPPCTCRTRVLWTADGGRTWHETAAVTAVAAGRGPFLFWRDASGTRLMHVRRWPPRGAIRSAAVAIVSSGRIAALTAVPGGVAALVTARVDGHGWDTAPRVLLYRNGKAAMLRLPATSGAVLVRSIAASWPVLVVHGGDFDRAGAPVPLTWRSRDGGRTWTRTPAR